MKLVEYKRGTLLYTPRKNTPLMDENYIILRYIEVGEFLFYLKRVHPHSRYMEVMTPAGETGFVLDTRLKELSP